MKRKHRGREFWEKTVIEFQQSSLAHEAFVEQKELKLSTFRRWFYQLRNSQKQATQFVELTAATPTAVVTSKTRLHLVEGVCLEFEQPPTPSYLAEVLQAIGHI